MRIKVPEELTASHIKYEGEAGRAWSAGLPALAERYLAEWELRLAGEPGYGMVALVLPVIRADGTTAVLKLQPVTEETAGEPTALRAWGGDASVLLLEHAPESGALLLERLHADRSLGDVPDDIEALKILTELLARLVAHPAPGGLRRLGDVARAMLGRAAEAVTRLPRERDRECLRWCADAVAEVVPEPGDRLLHWDLHYDNVLAGDRAPWLAIDPKPLAGDPGFELWPALWNRWDDVVATGDVPRAVLRRFDLMVDGLGLDPGRAARWTLGRVLQNVLWEVEDGESELHDIPLAVVGAVRQRT